MPPYILPLAECTDPRLVGGKAAGLGRLLAAGFSVPAGICVTTRAYRDVLHAAGIVPPLTSTLEEIHDAAVVEVAEGIRNAALPPTLLQTLDAALDGLPSREHGLWAVRSSATHEDASEASFAGQYLTRLGVQRDELPHAIRQCWASLWKRAAVAYAVRRGTVATEAMAVVIQPLLSPHAAGVAYSHHPVTGESGHVVVNAVLGLAEPLVAGTISPDTCTVDVAPTGPTILHRTVADKRTSRQPTAAGLVDVPLPASARHAFSLTDEQVFALTRLIKQVEATFGRPVDMEWALEHDHFWLLQARPIARPDRKALSASCVWSRANFKETLPDVPSPLGLALLHQFMERNILQHYRHLGCRVPDGMSSVRVVNGRPYINVTLFQHLLAQLGGDAASVVEQMGGLPSPPPVVDRLPALVLIRAFVRLKWRMWQARHHAHRWFAIMQRMAETAFAINDAPPTELLARMEDFGIRLHRGDLTFAIVSSVSEAFLLLRVLLERRLGAGWRSILNAALQGAGNVISARQIDLLRRLANLARADAAVRSVLQDSCRPLSEMRKRLAGTPFLEAFDRYLAEYGHRAVGESDVMSPRFSEDPTPLLAVVRAHLGSRSSVPSDAFAHQQNAIRQQALASIRSALGWRIHERIFFHYWYRRLVQSLALREANRHALMYFSTAVRCLARLLGAHYVKAGFFETSDDIFFLTPEEIRRLVAGTTETFADLVRERRAQHQAYQRQPAPDTLRDEGGLAAPVASFRSWHGLTLSAGIATGPARVLRTPADMAALRHGEIAVVPVIDPGMVSVFGLAAGLVAEMGGILSHGAIIAREYGLPAVANIPGITTAVQDGHILQIDADRGEVSLCVTTAAAAHAPVS